MTVQIHDFTTGEMVDPKEIHPGDVYRVEGNTFTLVCMSEGQLQGLRALLFASRKADNAARLRGNQIDDEGDV